MNGFLRTLLLKEQGFGLEIRPRLAPRYERPASLEGLESGLEAIQWRGAAPPTEGAEPPAAPFGSPEASPVPLPSTKEHARSLSGGEGVEARSREEMGDRPPKEDVPASAERGTVSPGNTVRSKAGTPGRLVNHRPGQTSERVRSKIGLSGRVSMASPEGLGSGLEAIQWREASPLPPRLPGKAGKGEGPGSIALTPRPAPFISTDGWPLGSVGATGGEPPRPEEGRLPQTGENASPGIQKTSRKSPGIRDAGIQDAGDDLLPGHRIGSAPTAIPTTRVLRAVHPGERPTIRVTIGRIEVRARIEQRPAPVATAPRRTPYRPPMPLEDYLKKRSEGL